MSKVCTTAALAGIEKDPVPKEEDQSPKINTNTVYHENKEMSTLGRKKAIRLKCLDCMCGSTHEVRLCTTKTCPLWTWRMGYEVDLETGARIKTNRGFGSKNDEENSL